MTRTEAANAIVDALEANDDYSASVWAPDGATGPVRVYVTIPAESWKKKAVKIGYVEIARDGALVPHLEKQKGSVMALIPALTIEATKSTMPPVLAVREESPDDPLERMEWEAARRNNDPMERG